MLKKILDLYKKGKELTLLEITYVILAVSFVFIAGIFALFNQALGVSLLIIPLIAIVAFAMNVVSWSLIKMAVEHLEPLVKDETEVKTESSVKNLDKTSEKVVSSKTKSKKNSTK